MSYAIVRTGGKQIKVSEGDVVAIERLSGEPGARVTLDDVLFVKTDAGSQIGTPTVSGAKVEVTIQEQARDKKVTMMKFRRRKGLLRRRGHRQYLTRVRIDSISA